MIEFESAKGAIQMLARFAHQRNGADAVLERCVSLLRALAWTGPFVFGIFALMLANDAGSFPGRSRAPPTAAALVAAESVKAHEEPLNFKTFHTSISFPQFHEQEPAAARTVLSRTYGADYHGQIDIAAQAPDVQKGELASVLSATVAAERITLDDVTALPHKKFDAKPGQEQWFQNTTQAWHSPQAAGLRVGPPATGLRYTGEPRITPIDTSASPYAMTYTDEIAQSLGVRNGQMDFFSVLSDQSSDLGPTISGGAYHGGAMVKLNWHPNN